MKRERERKEKIKARASQMLSRIEVGQFVGFDVVIVGSGFLRRNQNKKKTKEGGG